MPSFLFSSTFRKRHPVIPSSSFLPTPFSIFYESSTTPFPSISLKRFFFFTTKDNFARNLGTKLFSSFFKFLFRSQEKMNKLSVFSLFFITWLSDPCVTQVCLFLPKKEKLLKKYIFAKKRISYFYSRQCCCCWFQSVYAFTSVSRQDDELSEPNLYKKIDKHNRRQENTAGMRTSRCSFEVTSPCLCIHVEAD